MKTLSAQYYFWENRTELATKNRLVSRNFLAAHLDSEVKTQTDGYLYSQPLYPADWKAFADEEGLSAVASFSHSKKNDDAEFCYFQLKDFDHREVYLSEKDGKVDLWDTLRSELQKCKTQKTPLIIDLRYNHGGKYDNLVSLMNLLAPRRDPWLFSLRSLRVEHQNMGTFPCRGVAYFENLDALNMEVFNRMFCDTLRPYGIWDEGFDAPMVVLTTPYCMSSCDIAAEALNQMPNVALLGTPTEGAFNGISNLWNDTNMEIRNASILKFMADDMATFLATNGSAQKAHEVCHGPVCYHPLEGQSVSPDLRYEETIEDIVESPYGKGFRKAIGDTPSNQTPPKDLTID